MTCAVCGAPGEEIFCSACKSQRMQSVKQYKRSKMPEPPPVQFNQTAKRQF